MTRVAFFQKAVLIYYLETKHTVLKKPIFYHQYELRMKIFNILEQKIIKTTFSLEEKYLKIWTLENDYEL